MEKLTITVKGMHCASCISNIERSLKKVHGVKDVRISMLTGKAFVDSEGANKEEIVKAISRAGYKADKIES